MGTPLLPHVSRIVGAVLLVVLASCQSVIPNAPDRPIPHEVSIKKQFKAPEVTDVRLRYSKERPTFIKVLGMGSGSYRTLPIPEEAVIEWVDHSGKLQKRAVPVLSKVPMFMAEKTVCFEIDDAVLRVFVETSLPDYKKHRALIYED